MAGCAYDILGNLGFQDATDDLFNYTFTTKQVEKYLLYAIFGSNSCKNMGQFFNLGEYFTKRLPLMEQLRLYLK